MKRNIKHINWVRHTKVNCVLSLNDYIAYKFCFHYKNSLES